MAEPDRFARRRIDDEEVWVNLDQGEFYGLNRTATRILELWREGEHDVDAIVTRITAEFEVAPEEARRAVDDLLEEARRRGLLDAR